MHSKRLNARSVESISKPGRHSDGNGLYLAVDKTGGRRWVFIWRRASRMREMGLGSPARGVSLKLAREFAASAREALAKGLDPIRERDRVRDAAAGKPVLRDFVAEFIKANAPGWKNEKHARMWQASLDNHAGKILRMPVDEITTDDVVGVLQPLWAEKPDIARRLQNRLERILDAARVRGFREGDNPARWKGHLSATLPRKATSGRHFAALPYANVPAFVARLRTRPAPAAQALELLILTAARPSEVLGAMWSEIDLMAKVWTVPAARMKSGREHRVPLSTRAVEILETLGQHRSSEFVFPGKAKDKPLSAMAMAMLLRRMEAGKITAHGFRSSFRDWSGDETAFARELAEAALAHIVGDKAEQSYRRSDALERRRALMQAWCDFLKSGPRDSS